VHQLTPNRNSDGGMRAEHQLTAQLTS